MESLWSSKRATTTNVRPKWRWFSNISNGFGICLIAEPDGARNVDVCYNRSFLSCRRLIRRRLSFRLGLFGRGGWCNERCDWKESLFSGVVLNQMQTVCVARRGCSFVCYISDRRKCCSSRCPKPTHFIFTRRAVALRFIIAVNRGQWSTFTKNSSQDIEYVLVQCSV